MSNGFIGATACQKQQSYQKPQEGGNACECFIDVKKISALATKCSICESDKIEDVEMEISLDEFLTYTSGGQWTANGNFNFNYNYTRKPPVTVTVSSQGGGSSTNVYTVDIFKNCYVAPFSIPGIIGEGNITVDIGDGPSSSTFFTIGFFSYLRISLRQKGGRYYLCFSSLIICGFEHSVFVGDAGIFTTDPAAKETGLGSATIIIDGKSFPTKCITPDLSADMKSFSANAQFNVNISFSPQCNSNDLTIYSICFKKSDLEKQADELLKAKEYNDLEWNEQFFPSNTGELSKRQNGQFTGDSKPPCQTIKQQESDVAQGITYEPKEQSCPLKIITYCNRSRIYPDKNYSPSGPVIDLQCNPCQSNGNRSFTVEHYSDSFDVADQTFIQKSKAKFTFPSTTYWQIFFPQEIDGDTQSDQICELKICKQNEEIEITPPKDLGYYQIIPCLKLNEFDFSKCDKAINFPKFIRYLQKQ